jgi:hypothetical protein
MNGNNLKNNTMKNTIKNNRIFTIKYLGATDTKGSRVSITEARFNKTDRKVIPYSYKFNSTVEIAIDYLQSIGINVLGYGETKDSYIIFSDSWANGNGYINIKGENE